MNCVNVGCSPGIGFGLGVAVVNDSTRTRRISSNGEFYWVGAASTTFFVDPREGIVCIFLSQLRPWTKYNYMRELRVAVNQVRTCTTIHKSLFSGYYVSVKSDPCRQAVCDKAWAKI